MRPETPVVADSPDERPFGQSVLAPSLPVTQLERLSKFYPEAIPWVIEQTAREAEFRRTELKRLNTLAFVERSLGMLAGFGIGSLSLVVSLKLALTGHDWVAGVVGGATVVALVGAFIYGKSKDAEEHF